MRSLNVSSLFCLAILLPLLNACDQNKKTTTQQLTIPPTKIIQHALSYEQIKQNVDDYSAHWLSTQLLLLPKNNAAHHYSLTKLANNNFSSIALTHVKFPEKFQLKFPHLAKFQAFALTISTQEAKRWVKNRLIVIEQDPQQHIIKSSAVQTANLLDMLYTQNEHDANEVNDLGAKILNTDATISFKLWAPTAQKVQLLLFNTKQIEEKNATPTTLSMIEDINTGIWHTQAKQQFKAAYYQYKLTLYQPSTQRIETVITTDPYSLSLSTNSEYSQVTDLNRPSTQPKGWLQQQRPSVENVEDNIFYEVHIRDFSANDPQLSNPNYRGKYKAFSEKNSAGIKHLKELQAAGLNNIHLLPTFDIGTINETSSQSIDINDTLAKACKIAANISICQQNYNSKQTIKNLLNSYKNNSAKAQALVSELRPFDNYNWGYDPYHYTVPEGSYAINPKGEARLVEFREMIQSLHNLGFRVIMDVVYNHTHQAGLAKTSVLDKIVPNYYQRLNPFTGEIEHSTCCDNTATERVMMAKLMTDSLVVWARDYFIDGFRFDLMGHQPKAVMLSARAAVRKVDPDTYFYGEGWNFGEVANNQRFVQASQLELAGTEIGTYSDRLRDAIRGPSFNLSGNAIRKAQGLGNGLATMTNELANNKNYYLFADQTRIGLAGNLANFPLTNSQGEQVLGKDIPYGNQPTGYALDPADTINYVSKHDNQTLWDNNQYRIAFNVSRDNRVRMQLQSLAFTLFAQGLPFVQMGAELLRSKSFLRDSYDYGDWFNRVDFTKQTNFYDIGLPPAEKDQENWLLIKQVLTQNQGRDHVSAKQIQLSSDVFNEMLRIRMSSSLFRLTTAAAIIKQVSFLNTGKDQQQGLIVMNIKFAATNASSTDKQPFKQIMVIFNTNATTQHFAYPQASLYKLHPVQKNSVDSVVKQSQANDRGFSIPALTTTVFVR